MFLGLLIIVHCISLAEVYGSSCTTLAPTQVRVALRGVNGVTISWKTTGSKDTPNPQVEYSTSSTLLNSVLSAVGTNSNYNTQSYFHDVGLVNLAAGTKYYYRILVPTDCTTKPSIYSFTTAPTVGDSKPINITLIGDLGNNAILASGGGANTIKALKKVAASTNFFFHSGDISYADDFPLYLQSYEKIWNDWQDNMQSITAQNIYMTGPGNHEVTCNQLGDKYCGSSDPRNFAAYLARFRMPGNESNGYKNLWYSFDYGLVHVVAINTETDFPNAPSGPNTALNGQNFQGLTGQLSWLENDLKKANASRAKVPWIIVTGHRPFFSSVPALPAIPGDCTACGAAFIPLIIKYNVDFYVSGHVHWYERLYPINANGVAVAKNYTNPSGFIHITNGAGGAPEGAAKLKTKIAASANIVTGFGYSQLQIKDKSNARLTFFSADTNKEVDAVNIVRKH